MKKRQPLARALAAPDDDDDDDDEDEFASLGISKGLGGVSGADEAEDETPASVSFSEAATAAATEATFGSDEDDEIVAGAVTEATENLLDDIFNKENGEGADSSGPFCWRYTNGRG